MGRVAPTCCPTPCREDHDSLSVRRWNTDHVTRIAAATIIGMLVSAIAATHHPSPRLRWTLPVDAVRRGSGLARESSASGLVLAKQLESDVRQPEQPRHSPARFEAPLPTNEKSTLAAIDNGTTARVGSQASRQ